MIRRGRPMLPAAVLTVGWLPATGCSCPDIESNAASIAVELPVDARGDAAEVCINGTCALAGEPISYDGTWVERFFDDPAIGVRDDEDFEVRITILDAAGAPLASRTETRNFDVDPCRCLSFPYRWTGDEIERAD